MDMKSWEVLGAGLEIPLSWVGGSFSLYGNLEPRNTII